MSRFHPERAPAMTARASFASRLRLSRAQWVKLIGAAQGLARAAGEAAGEPGGGAADGRSAGEAIEAFRRELRGAKGEDFPNPARIASTGWIAAAFVACAQGFAVASPERRSASAPALGELARLLDGCLEELRTSEAHGHYWAGRD